MTLDAPNLNNFQCSKFRAVVIAYLLGRRLFGRALLGHLLELPLVTYEARDKDGDDGDERDDDEERREARRRQAHAVHDLARVLHPTLR